MQQTSEQKQKNINNRGGFYMFNKMKHMKNEKGLTLIELLAVIVILAIISAIAIPAIGNIINNSRDKAILSDASNMLSGVKLAIADGACGPATATTQTCTSATLKDVFEGPVVDTDSVVYHTATKVYTINYEALGKIKNVAKFTVAKDTRDESSSEFKPPAKIITDEQLRLAMGK